MGDLRSNVSEPVHAVLDLLERGRAAWGSLSDNGLRREIDIEIAVLSQEQAEGADVMRSPAVRRMAALLLFAIECAATDAGEGGDA